MLVSSLLGYVLQAIVVGGSGGVVVVVTFSYLKPDVERLMCGGVLYSIVPPGVDPHEYQLKPSDQEVLRSADIVVSTGHTSFEQSIRGMVERGEIKAILLDIIEDTGVRLKVNPVTKQYNYHMPVNDPVNYLLFLSKLVEVLVRLNPGSKECIYEKYARVVSNVTSTILVNAGRFRGKAAIVDAPHAQYLAEWLGFEVVQVLKAEEEYQVSPGDVEKAIDLARRGEVSVVFVTKPGVQPEGAKLIEIAREFNISVVMVDSPSGGTGVLENLVQLVNQISAVHTTPSTTPSLQNTEANYPTAIVTGIVILAGGLGFLAGYVFKSRRLMKVYNL
jgi:zinc/manganese transport system substrate-binding protein